MATTSPDNISYPSPGFTGGVEQAIKDTADSVQAALALREMHTYVWADAAARAAQTGMSAGDMGMQTDTGVLFQYLTYRSYSTGWIPVGGKRPAAQLSVSALSIPNSSATALGGTSYSYTEDYDAFSWHDATTNPTRITPTFAGRYRILVQSQWASNVTGGRIMAARKNGTNLTGGGPTVAGSVDGLGNITLNTEADLNGSSDYIDVTAFQNSGGALNLTAVVTVEHIGALA